MVFPLFCILYSVFVIKHPILYSVNLKDNGNVVIFGPSIAYGVLAKITS